MNSDGDHLFGFACLGFKTAMKLNENKSILPTISMRRLIQKMNLDLLVNLDLLPGRR
jgi:hypothetical protein